MRATDEPEQDPEPSGSSAARAARWSQTLDRGSAWARSGPALALLAAVLLALAFPDFNLSWLAFVGLVPLLRATRRATPRRAAFLARIIRE